MTLIRSAGAQFALMGTFTLSNSAAPIRYAVETTMNQYLLILRDDPAVFQGLSPQQIQEVFAKYVAWRTRLHEAGRLVGGNKLEDGTGRLLSAAGPSSPMRITDGPFAESKELIAGYFMINAETYEDAVELCRDCPHLEYGVIEVRRVEKT
jgi:hypothetical protein